MFVIKKKSSHYEKRVPKLIMRFVHFSKHIAVRIKKNGDFNGVFKECSKAKRQMISNADSVV